MVVICLVNLKVNSLPISDPKISNISAIQSFFNAILISESAQDPSFFLIIFL